MKLKDVDFKIDPCLLEPNFIQFLLDAPDDEVERAAYWSRAFNPAPSRDAETTCG